MTDPTVQPGEARIRRAPRLPVFLVLGAVLGAILALILTATGNLDPKVGFGATFGYLCFWCVPIGLVVGALVGLALDVLSRRRARTVLVERATVEGDEVEDTSH
jgi:F0F1-type ATP synthase assembly protein I